MQAQVPPLGKSARFTGLPVRGEMDLSKCHERRSEAMNRTQNLEAVGHGNQGELAESTRGELHGRISRAGWVLALGLLAGPPAVAGEGVWTAGHLDGGPAYAVAAASDDTLLAATWVNGIMRKQAAAAWHPIAYAESLFVGRVIAPAPSRLATVYLGAGSPAPRVFVSTDGGATWTPRSTGLELVGASANDIAVDPSNPDIAYLAISPSASGASVHKTTNQGQSWAPVTAGLLSDQGLPWTIDDIEFDPRGNGIVYAAGTKLFKSTNGGKSWKEIGAGQAVGNRLLVDPSNPSRLLVGRSFGNLPLYFSEDGGASWSARDGLTNVRELAASNHSPALFFAIAGSQNELFRSSDSGTTWEPLETGFGSMSLNDLKYDAAKSRLLLASAAGVLESPDLGETWTLVDPKGYRGVAEAAMAAGTQAGTAYAGDSSGVFRSVDGGHSWELRSIEMDPLGVETNTQNGIATAPSEPTTLWAVGNRSVKRSADGGATWQRVAGDANFGGATYPMAVAVSPSNPEVAVVGNLGQNYPEYEIEDPAAGIFRSVDGGANWARVYGPAYDRIGFFQPFSLAFDPSAPQVALAGALVTFAGSSSLSGIVLRSVDGGASWSEVLVPDPNGSFPIVRFDGAGGAWAAFSFGTGGAPTLWRSTDRGATWNEVLTPTSIRSIEVHPSAPGTLFLQSFDALYVTTDGAASWTALPLNGLPEPVAMRSLGIVPNGATSTLLVGGNGDVYSLCLSGPDHSAPCPPPPCEADETTLCLDDAPGDERFEVRMAFETVQAGGISGQGRAINLSGLGVTRGGLFHFGDPTNPEMLIKVLNGCPINEQHWVFFSAGTNVGFQVEVRDTVTGDLKVYTNPDLTAAPPVQDTDALACSSGPESGNVTWLSAPNLNGALVSPAARSFSRAEDGGACATTDTSLCIAERFRVEVAYETVQAGGLSGSAQALPLASLGVDRGGLFYFFESDNPEMLIKVLDGCAINEHFWIYYSAGTNVGLEVTVTDVVTGESVAYSNEDLTAALPVQDVSALPCD